MFIHKTNLHKSSVIMFMWMVRYVFWCTCTCLYLMFCSFSHKGFKIPFFTSNQLTWCVTRIQILMNQHESWISLSQASNRLGSFTVHCFSSCSVFYVFYEQYLTIVKDTWQNLLYCAGKFLLFTFDNMSQTWPPLLSNHFLKISKVSKSNHYDLSTSTSIRTTFQFYFSSFTLSQHIPISFHELA